MATPVAAAAATLPGPTAARRSASIPSGWPSPLEWNPCAPVAQANARPATPPRPTGRRRVRTPLASLRISTRTGQRRPFGRLASRLQTARPRPGRADPSPAMTRPGPV